MIEISPITILLAVGLASLLTFIYRYMRYSPWWQTLQGWMMLWSKLNLASVFLFYLVNSLIPPYDLQPALTLIVFSLLVLSTIGMTVALIHAQTHPYPPDTDDGKFGIPPEVERTLERLTRRRPKKSSQGAGRER